MIGFEEMFEFNQIEKKYRAAIKEYAEKYKKISKPHKNFDCMAQALFHVLISFPEKHSRIAATAYLEMLGCGTKKRKK